MKVVSLLGYLFEIITLKKLMKKPTKNIKKKKRN